MKALIIGQQSHLISIQPIKAQIGQRKDYNTVLKYGYLLLEAIPLAGDEKTMNFQEKENFLLNYRNLASLLLVDPKKPESKKINFKFNELRNGYL